MPESLAADVALTDAGFDGRDVLATEDQVAPGDQGVDQGDVVPGVVTADVNELPDATGEPVFDGVGVSQPESLPHVVGSDADGLHDLTAAVNTSGWKRLPIADRDVKFAFRAAIDRLAAHDMRKAFRLTHADPIEYRLPGGVWQLVDVSGDNAWDHVSLIDALIARGNLILRGEDVSAIEASIRQRYVSGE